MSDFGINRAGDSSLGSLQAIARKDKNDAPGFTELLGRSIDQVEQRQQEADRAMQDLATGSRRTLHETMIQVEKADISFRLLMAVRSKLVQAYQEISRMHF